jgi:hypothetical protein
MPIRRNELVLMARYFSRREGLAPGTLRTFPHGPTRCSEARGGRPRIGRV